MEAGRTAADVGTGMVADGMAAMEAGIATLAHGRSTRFATIILAECAGGTVLSWLTTLDKDAPNTIEGRRTSFGFFLRPRGERQPDVPAAGHRHKFSIGAGDRKHRWLNGDEDERTSEHWIGRGSARPAGWGRYLAVGDAGMVAREG